MEWCGNSDLKLNINKTEGMIVTFFPKQRHMAEAVTTIIPGNSFYLNNVKLQKFSFKTITQETVVSNFLCVLNLKCANITIKHVQTCGVDKLFHSNTVHVLFSAPQHAGINIFSKRKKNKTSCFTTCFSGQLSVIRLISAV